MEKQDVIEHTSIFTDWPARPWLEAVGVGVGVGVGVAWAACSFLLHFFERISHATCPMAAS